MDDNESSEESLQQKQRLERKQLQAEIQKLKHAVPKGDKKRKKEVTLQVAQLEAEMDQKHEQELKDFQEQQHTTKVENISDNLERLDTEERTNDDNAQTKQPPKKSKAQKRREKKEQDAREREERIKAGEKENLLGPRHLELKGLKEKLTARGLQIYEIPSDGDCLYAAIAHQLEHEHTVDELRKLAADYMRDHASDFLPFLCHPDTGDLYTEDQFEEYCHKLESTSEWGGQLEIQALSSCLECPIEVIQSDSPSVHSGDQYTDKPNVILTYHRHAYKLGEHYNAVVPKTEDSDEEEHNT